MATLWEHGRRWRTFAGILLCVGVLVTAAFPVAAVGTYTDPSGYFALTLPDGWSVQQVSDTNFEAEWSSADGNAIALLSYQTLASGTDSLAFYNANRTSIGTLPGFQPITTRYVTSNGANQPLVEFTFVSGGQTLRAQEVFIANNTDGWTLTFLASNATASRYAPAFTTIVQSFALASIAGNSGVIVSATTVPVMTVPAAARPAQGQASQGATGSPQTGHYDCQGYGNIIAGGFTLAANGTYRLDDGTGGSYSYDSATHRVNFTSGPYAQGGFYGTYFTSDNFGPHYPTINLSDASTQNGGLSCQIPGLPG